MKYSKLALMLAMGAVLPCRADDTKPADVSIPGPIATTSEEDEPIDLLGNDYVATSDLLKVIARSFGNFSISVDENIRGSLYGVNVAAKNWVQALDYIAKKASLSITLSDNGTVVATQLPKGQFKTILPQPAKGSGFQLKLLLDKQQFLPDDAIESKIQLERDAGQPAANVMWGSLMKANMQLTLISLGDYALVASDKPFNPMNDYDRLEYLTAKPTRITADSPLRLPYSLSRRLKYSLKPGRYLYYVTYRSQPKGTTLKGQPIWEGELSSNVVEFEVLPAIRVTEKG